LTPYWGFYFAGLADGEGHFAIFQHKRGWSCRFTIKLRADDLPLLETLRDETGLGVIYTASTTPTPERQNKPAFQWHISLKRDCIALVDIFSDYPLRSKKAEEFRVWSDAVEYWHAPDRHPGRDKRGHRLLLMDWEPMERAATELRAIRAYIEPLELREAVPA
jgi:hypothetical protein